mgnify:CR=1 FL=1
MSFSKKKDFLKFQIDEINSEPEFFAQIITKNEFEKVYDANKYYDERQPWVQKKEDIEGFKDTIYTCAVIIANLSNLFEPFMPKSCEKIREFLSLDKTPVWKEIQVKYVILSIVRRKSL